MLKYIGCKITEYGLGEVIYLKRPLRYMVGIFHEWKYIEPRSRKTYTADKKKTKSW